MKIVLWAFIVLGGALILITVIGWLLPKGHVATRVGHYKQSPEAVWKAITDVDAMPAWREGLKSVKRLPDRSGLPAWVETVSGTGEIPLETVSSQAPQKLVTRIADPKLPFGGTWTYELAATTDGCTLRITENGEVYNPLFRFLSRFVFGQAGTIETYLKSLAKKFGEEPRIGE